MSQNSLPPLAAPAVDETSQVVSDQVHIKNDCTSNDFCYVHYALCSDEWQIQI